MIRLKGRPMELLVGLVVFTLGLGAFVFPRQVASALGDVFERDVGHRSAVAVRAFGIVAAVVGFWLLL